MNKKILKGVVINFIVTLIVGFLSFVVNRNFSRYMGVNELGLMKLFTQMIAYLSLAEMGLSTASAYSLYKPLAEKNYKKISVIISTIDFLYKRVAIIILLFGLLLNPLIPYCIKDYQIDSKIYLLWSLYVLNVSLTYAFSKYSILFIANQEHSFVRIVQGVAKIISQLFQIIIVTKYKSFELFIIVLIIDSLIQYFFYRKHYKKNYPFITSVKEREKNIVNNLFFLFCHKVGGLIVCNTDYIIISVFIDLKTVGIYASYLMINQIIITVISTVTNVINPYIGNFIVKNNSIEIYKLWKRIDILFVYIGLIFTYITFKLINNFIELWLGREFLLSELTVFLLMVNLFISSIRIITEIFKINCGFFNDIHLPIAEGGINLVFSLFLVKKIGINGVIIGTIVSNIVIVYIFKPILVFNRCFAKKAKDYLKIVFKYLLLATISIVVSENIFNYLNLIQTKANWQEYLLLVIIVFLIVAIVTFFVFLLNKEFRENIIILYKR